MYLISIWLGKCISWSSRVSGSNGSAIPGYVIERINKRFLAKAMGKLPQGVVLVTGTNGKTTTTKLLAELLQGQGLRVLTNNTGSNFVRGIISLVVDKATLSGQLPYDIAVLEQDEAYAAKFVEQFSPRGVVVLNIMRDQMDRFGEIDTTAKLLQKVVQATTGFVVLNAHDPRVSKLSEGIADKVRYFDVSAELAHEFPNDDDLHSKEIIQKTLHPDAQVVLESIKGQQVTYAVDGHKHTVTPKVSGKHNYFNAAAALTATLNIKEGIDTSTLVESLASIAPAFGRGEELQIGNLSLRLQLVKNPAGFLQSLKLLSEQPYQRIMVAINDDYADGRDMSWLWDVTYGPIKAANPNLLITSGTRAADMAVRLKYDDIQVGTIESDLPKALDTFLQGDQEANGMVFCTYTAMLELRKLLVKMGHTEKVQ